MILPRRFALRRDYDVSGISGTGYVAYGIQFMDGHVVMRWDTDTRSTAVYESIEHLERIHAHGGATRVVWIDDAKPVEPASTVGGSLIEHFSKKDEPRPYTMVYDPEARAGYLYISDGKIVETVEVNDTVNVDLDENGMAVGVEVLF